MFQVKLVVTRNFLFPGVLGINFPETQGGIISFPTKQLRFPTTRIISGFERETTNDCPHFGYPDFSILFTLYTDASGDSIGFNLTQVQHGKERTIVYGGWNFSGTEKKYSVTEREVLPVIVAIQKCRPYLLGNHFTVVVDHMP